MDGRKQLEVVRSFLQRSFGTRRAFVQTAAITGTASIAGYLFYNQYKINKELAKSLEGEEIEVNYTLPQTMLIKNKNNQQTGKRTRFDQALFFKRLQRLLPIVIPSWKSKEVLLLIFHTSVLLARTFISIYVAKYV